MNPSKSDQLSVAVVRSGQQPCECQVSLSLWQALMFMESMERLVEKMKSEHGGG